MQPRGADGGLQGRNGCETCGMKHCALARHLARLVIPLDCNSSSNCSLAGSANSPLSVGFALPAGQMQKWVVLRKLCLFQIKTADENLDVRYTKRGMHG